MELAEGGPAGRGMLRPGREQRSTRWQQVPFFLRGETSSFRDERSRSWRRLNSTAQPSASACLRASPAKVPSRGKEKDQQEQTPMMRSSDRQLV